MNNAFLFFLFRIFSPRLVCHILWLNFVVTCGYHNRFDAIVTAKHKKGHTRTHHIQLSAIRPHAIAKSDCLINCVLFMLKSTSEKSRPYTTYYNIHTRHILTHAQQTIREKTLKMECRADTKIDDRQHLKEKIKIMWDCFDGDKQ